VATKNSAISLKASITTAIVLVSLLSLILSVFFTTYFSNRDKENEAVYFAKVMTEIIAFNALVPITFDQREGIDSFLDTLKNIDEISYIHIYRTDEITSELEFFSSYNQRNYPPITPQFHRIKLLNTPLFSEDYVEYGAPIIDDGTKENIGYVYLRLQLEHYNKNMATLAKYNILIAIVVAIIAFFVSQLIQQRILTPINKFVKEIQQITFNKDFDNKVASPDFIEMRLLADSVNAMLAKINQQIFQYSQAEKEITELNQNLEEKVVNRTQALRDSNQELLDALEQVHQYQSQVIQSEKMASLGQMVAGVAHEVNTPIGLGVTASTMLSDKIVEITQALSDQTLSAKKLQRFLEESKENTDIIYRNLSRAADLISSFKQVAVDQTADNIRKIEVGSFLKEIILSLHPTLKKANHEIVINCDDNLSIKTKPGPINQIIINLIMNSLIHGFKDIDNGRIVINVECSNNKCKINYFDNGHGIEEKIKQKIFDPFVTTRRGEGGSGLGLHLVYNLVTQALNGNIDVESQLGEGAEFIIEFPAVTVEANNG